jgi:hypothetical protein
MAEDTKQADRVRELEAELTAQKAQFTATEADAVTARAELDALKARLADEAKARRVEAVRQLFTALGRDPRDEAAASHYLAMSDEAFAAVSADLLATVQAKGSTLFTHQATHGPDSAPKAAVINYDKIYSARRVKS